MSIMLTWKPEVRQVADLREWDRNPRVITGEALEKLKGRIEQRGFHDVVKIDVDGTILSGTQRYKALMVLGVTEVWAMVPDRSLTEEEREKVVLESNRNDGDWDWGALKGFDIPTLVEIGFKEDELRINFGLDSAGDVDLDQERLQILAVVPPETPSLKERAVVRMRSIEDYHEVKAAILSGRISSEELLAIARRS